jgi:N-methylhydantoinase A
MPGPACYGRGGLSPTVTDANLLLGRISESRFLGGEMPLDRAAALLSFGSICATLGVSVQECAIGIVRIATSAMANVVRQVTTEKGLDVREFALIAYGGGGPLHASLVARELQIRRVIIPVAPGHFSAFGMLVADLRRDYVRTIFSPLSGAPFETFDAIFEDLEGRGTAEIRSTLAVDGLAISRAADMRYVGQEHAVAVDIDAQLFADRDAAAIKRLFDATHRAHYGYCTESEPAEIVSLRVAVTGLTPKPVLERIGSGGRVPAPDALIELRPVYFSSLIADTPVYRRSALLAQNCVVGPALIEEHASTTVLLPGDSLSVDEFGNLRIDIRYDQAPSAPHESGDLALRGAVA